MTINTGTFRPVFSCSFLLDLVYTGKAFAGMLNLIEKGLLGSDEPIIFLHTGGLPALFAF
jgi:D-cysteine desulfhydrase